MYRNFKYTISITLQLGNIVSLFIVFTIWCGWCQALPWDGSVGCKPDTKTWWGDWVWTTNTVSHMIIECPQLASTVGEELWPLIVSTSAIQDLVKDFYNYYKSLLASYLR